MVGIQTSDVNANLAPVYEMTMEFCMLIDLQKMGGWGGVGGIKKGKHTFA
jgi:hypothetical protein